MSGNTFASRLPQGLKNHFVAGMGEFIGTFCFIFFCLGGTSAVNTSGNQSSDFILASDPSQLLYICICFGFSLAVSVWLFFRVSGGQFNPAVTLALVLVGAVGPVRGVVNFLAQILAAMSACAILSVLFPGPLQATTTLRSDVNVAQGLFIEMFATSILVLAVLMMAVEKHRATPMAPLCIGLALFVAELTSIPFTGGSVNPARSFGPCVATRTFTHYHWIYWIGPFLGALLATAVYKTLKVLEYETANPGQDDDGIRELLSSSTLPSSNSSNQHSLGGRKLSGDTRFGESYRNAGLAEAGQIAQ